MQQIVPRTFSRSASSWLAVVLLVGLSYSFLWAASSASMAHVNAAERGFLAFGGLLTIGVVGWALLTGWYPLVVDEMGLKQGLCSIAWADITTVEIKMAHIYRGSKISLVVHGAWRDREGHLLRDDHRVGVLPLDQIDADRSILLSAILHGLDGRGKIIGKDTSGDRHRTCNCTFRWEQRSSPTNNEQQLTS